MKKIIFLILVLAITYQTYGQVGIGTNSPDSSAMLEVQSAERGILFPRMTSAQRNGIVSPANGLYVFDTNSNSLWYFNGTVWINTTAEASLGDVKSGFQTTDHSGWIQLDGRAVNTLNANQEAAAIALGFTTNLPDASSAYLVQNGSGMGAVAGANTTTITQANLPNVSFNGTAASSGGHNHGGTTDNAGGHSHTGTTNNNGTHQHSGTTNGAGGHSHSISRRGNEDDVAYDPGNARASESSAATTDRGFQGSFSTNAAGNHVHSFTTGLDGGHNHNFSTNTVANHNHNISNDGAHTHSVTVSSGGSSTPINTAPRSMSVNMFVYLGQ